MRKIALFVIIGLLMTGTVFAWPEGYPVIKTKTKVVVPDIDSGLKVLVNEYNRVRVVNLNVIQDKQWTYKYGDKCQINQGWETEVIGTIRSGKTTQVLLRVSSRPDSGPIIGCPTDTLFFMSANQVKQMLYREAKRKADEAAEKKAVKRLLENKQQPKK